MARPKNLQTKGYFNVLEKRGNYYLCFRGVELFSYSSRNRLYTERAKYSSWFKRIVSLLKSTNTKLEDIIL